MRAVPVRQWVLSLPFALRYRLAYDRTLVTPLLAAFLRAVFASLRRRARASLGVRRTLRRASSTRHARGSSRARRHRAAPCPGSPAMRLQPRCGGGRRGRPVARPSGDGGSVRGGRAGTQRDGRGGGPANRAPRQCCVSERALGSRWVALCGAVRIFAPRRCCDRCERSGRAGEGLPGCRATAVGLGAARATERRSHPGSAAPPMAGRHVGAGVRASRVHGKARGAGPAAAGPPGPLPRSTRAMRRVAALRSPGSRRRTAGLFA